MHQELPQSLAAISGGIKTSNPLPYRQLLDSILTLDVNGGEREADISTTGLSLNRRVTIIGIRISVVVSKPRKDPMPKTVIDTPLLMQPIAHFSHAVRMHDIVYAGATAGTEPTRRLAGETIGRVDVAAQSDLMFRNLEKTLELLHATHKQVAKMKIFVSDMRDVGICLDVFRRIYPDAQLVPTIVGSPGFPLPQAAVELDAVCVGGVPINHLRLDALATCTVAGDRLFGTAQSGTDAWASGHGSVAVQAKKVLARIIDLVINAGLRTDDIVNLNVTMTDVRDGPIFDNAIGDMLRPPFPTCTVVGAALPDPTQRFQVEVTAVRGGGVPVEIAEPGNAMRHASSGMLFGRELMISAQHGVLKGNAYPSSVEAQTLLAWGRVQQLLQKCGMDIQNVLRTNNVLNDWRHFSGFNAGYGATVSRPYPNRATVLGFFVDEKANVHIDAIAHLDALSSTVLEANHGTQ